MASRPSATDAMIRMIFQRDCFMIVPQTRRPTACRVLRPASLMDVLGPLASRHRMQTVRVLCAFFQKINPTLQPFASYERTAPHGPPLTGCRPLRPVRSCRGRVWPAREYGDHEASAAFSDVVSSTRVT